MGTGRQPLTGHPCPFAAAVGGDLGDLLVITVNQYPAVRCGAPGRDNRAIRVNPYDIKARRGIDRRFIEIARRGFRRLLARRRCCVRRCGCRGRRICRWLTINQLHTEQPGTDQGTDDNSPDNEAVRRLPILSRHWLFSLCLQFLLILYRYRSRRLRATGKTDLATSGIRFIDHALLSTQNMSNVPANLARCGSPDIACLRISAPLESNRQNQFSHEVIKQRLRLLRFLQQCLR